MSESVEVAIVGAGHAGLSLSHELTAIGMEHLILERRRVAETWRNRWDSFCLVTPNFTMQLPGGHYQGDDPEGFIPRDEIVDHIVRYSQSFSAPVRENVEVLNIEPGDGAGFRLDTTSGTLQARHVVLASGGYQKPYRPPAAAQLPPSLQVIDSDGYGNPQGLQDGKVLVVGSGQTGVQIAEELFESGREVYLSCGKAPWIPRRLDGRDTVAWFLETPFFEGGMETLPHPAARLGANPQATGRKGGHDLHFRTLQALGVEMTGHLAGVEDGTVYFAPDLVDSVAFGDQVVAKLVELLEMTMRARGIKPPAFPRPAPFDADPPESVRLRDLGAVVFTCGYRPDYLRLIHRPDAFDDWGFPIQKDGSSTVIPGLHFMGVHFQRKRKSATLFGAAEDAAVLAGNLRTAAPSS